jgi:putative polyhydroxyalkanoate system protein
VSTVTINRAHDLSQAACEQALDELEAYLSADLHAQVSRFGNRLTFDGRGFEGAVVIEPGSASGQIKLGLLARPFRRQLEEEINRHLDARLGA